MDYGAFPPEVNSALMYSGPGPWSLLAAATAWNGLAAELHSAAASYESVISGLIASWQGPSSAAMESAAAPYVAWLNSTATQAELSGGEAQAAAAAFQSAFGMMVPPPVIEANRIQLMQLVSTNLLGQNTPAIAATETAYAEMWAQDAMTMYSYAASSAVITGNITPFTPAPETTNAAGLIDQGAQPASSAGGSTASTLSKVVNSVPNALQNLSTPGGSSGSSGGVTTVNPVTGTTTTTGAGSNMFDGVLTSVLSSYATIPGDFAMFMGADAISPLMQTMSMAFQPAAVAPAAMGELPGMAAAAGGAMGPGFAGGMGGMGGMAGLGQAASVGGLSVPANWGWAATAPPGLVGSAPMGLAPAMGLATAESGVGSGFPMMLGGLPRAAAMGAGIGAGAAAVKYGSRLRVMARPPAAGYSEGTKTPSPAVAKYPVPAQFPTNGHAPPGYQPAIVYLPTNGEKTADV